jgi:hypothetical protein
LNLRLFTFFDIIGVILFFLPSLAEDLFLDETLARAIGASIFATSFLFANFQVYRTLRKEYPEIDEESFAIYGFTTGPYNAAQIHYFGLEPCRDLDVRILYTEPEGASEEIQVTEFFPSSDRDMIWHHSHVRVLQPNQSVIFRLIRKKHAPTGFVTLSVGCIGTISRKQIKFSQRVNLVK